MSGFPSKPSSSLSNIFNPSFYTSDTDYLTLGDANQLYCGMYDFRLNSITRVTSGVATATKALVLDGSKNVTGINSISCSSLTVNGVPVTGATTSLSLTNGLITDSGNNIAYDNTNSNFNAGHRFSVAGGINYSGSMFRITNSYTSDSMSIDYVNLTSGGAPKMRFYTSGSPLSFTSSNNSGTANITLGSSGSYIGLMRHDQVGSFKVCADATIHSTTGFVCNRSSQDACISVAGDGTNYLDGTYTRAFTAYGSNASPVSFQIEVNNGTNSTSTNAAWLGTISNNDLRFGVNNSTEMTLSTAGYLNISTTGSATVNALSPTVENTFTTILDSAVTTNITGSSYSLSASLVCSGGVVASEYVATSDRRIKKDIRKLSIVECKRMVKQMQPYIYTKNEQTEVGMIAQEISSDSTFVKAIEVDKMDATEPGDIEDALLTLDYARMVAPLASVVIICWIL